MSKVELIKEAIERGLRRESNLTPLALSVPMLGSLNIRHLLNNLGSLSTVYCDHGSHVGGSYCSAVFKNTNLTNAISIDSWASDATEGHHYEQDFRDNALIMTPPETELQIIKSDSFSVDLSEIHQKIDFYYFDGSHDYLSQRKALTYYLPVLADIFLYAVDDYMLKEVREGAQDGIVESGCEILFEREFETDSEYSNESFWRSWYVCLLKKKS
jgi:hypothetical protein